MRGAFFYFLFWLISWYPTQAYSQDLTELSFEELFDIEMIELASGIAQSLNKAPAIANIITAEDIKEMGAKTLDEVLIRVPGLHIIPSILNRLDPVYSFRGIYTDFNPQVLILLNGKRISRDLLSGGRTPNFRQTVKYIKRVEIIRGPGSALYGSDAFSGVINIITKQAHDISGFETGIGTGSYQRKNLWWQYGGAISENWNLTVNLEYNKQAADTSRIINSDAQSLFDQAFQTEASLAPSYVDKRYTSTQLNAALNNKHWRIALDSWHQRDLGLGAGTANALDHKGNDKFKQHLFTGEYDTEDLLRNWKIGVDFNYFYNDTKTHLILFPAESLLPIGMDGNLNTSTPVHIVSFPDGYIGKPAAKSKIYELSVPLLYSGFNKHKIRVQLGARREKLSVSEQKNFGPGVIDVSHNVIDGTLTDVTGTPYIFVEDNKTSVHHFALQDIWQLADKWELTLGARYDHYSDVGDTVNPKAALVWSSSEKLTTKFLYGRAFRAPSIIERKLRNNPVALGNANLNHEEIDTYEFAFNYITGKNSMTTISLYYYEANNLITTVPDPGGLTRTSQNHNDLTGIGFEAETVWYIGDWHLSANYSFNNTESDITKEQQPFVPQQSVYFDARWKPISPFVFTVQSYWVGKRARENNDTRPEIDDYSLVNLLGSYRYKHFVVSTGIKNVFNADAREPSSMTIPDDIPLNDRSFWLELSYKY